MSTITPLKTDLGWIVEVTHEIAQALGIADGSLALLHPRGGTIEVEILARPTYDLTQSAKRINDKYREAFEEMKRLGD